MTKPTCHLLKDDKDDNNYKDDKQYKYGKYD